MATGIKEVLVVAPDYGAQRERFLPWGKRERCLEMLERAGRLQMEFGESSYAHGPDYMTRAMCDTVGISQSCLPDLEGP